ncbi:hypothetical protein HMPREF0663_12144 [Hoylesella oralis ATCC 33269]|uniref:Uncharacterized protein n=1 Tax=Hoylesella oralis ATCC 33269 TaxID=873533 RepID=E7RS76_9BACT|nr:hypothetical protein HMPREF0663_12144 [Hoylesella oralis ATCC 33269]
MKNGKRTKICNRKSRKEIGGQYVMGEKTGMRAVPLVKYYRL